MCVTQTEDSPTFTIYVVKPHETYLLDTTQYKIQNVQANYTEVSETVYLSITDHAGTAYELDISQNKL